MKNVAGNKNKINESPVTNENRRTIKKARGFPKQRRIEKPLFSPYEYGENSMKNNNTFNVSLTKRVRLPQEIAVLLIDEARRCKRTVPKQIEAILCAYYGADIELQDILDAEVIG